MKRVTAIVAAALVAMAANFFGVVFFFRPIAEGDAGVGLVPPPAIGFLIYVLLSVFVLDWAVQRFGQPFRVGLVIAASQIILVVDLVLRGERGFATGAAGAILILVTWTAMGFAYRKVLPDRKTAADQAAHGV